MKMKMKMQDDYQKRSKHKYVHNVVVAWYDVQELILPKNLYNISFTAYDLYLGNGNIETVQIIKLQTKQGNATHSSTAVNGTSLTNNTLEIFLGYTPQFIVYDVT